MSLCCTGCGKHAATGGMDAPVYVPAYASGFRITGDTATGNTVIESMAPWQGADSVVRRLLILREGAAPAGFDGQVLRGDARRVVAMSSTHIAMLDAIGALGTVAGVSGKDYVCNPVIAASEVADVGFEGALNYELLASLNPDIVLLYGVSGPSVMEQKLEALGIPYIYVGDYLEQSPLGKAEWAVALGEITGHRAEAEAFMEPLAVRYDSLRTVAAQASGKPRVMFNSPYGTAWYMPPAGSYAVRLVEDAGGEYVYGAAGGNTSVNIDMEEAYLLASQADKWINVTGFPSLAAFRRAYPRFAGVPAVRAGEVYANDARSGSGGGNDFFESAVMHPDVVLEDMIAVIHPEIAADSVLTYYRRLSE